MWPVIPIRALALPKLTPYSRRNCSAVRPRLPPEQTPSSREATAWQR
jgi:hypothetical protein